MKHRPGSALLPAGAALFAPAAPLQLSLEPAGFYQLPPHPPTKFLVPVEAAEFGARSLYGEPRAPRRLGQRRPANRLPVVRLNRTIPAFAIFGVF